MGCFAKLYQCRTEREMEVFREQTKAFANFMRVQLARLKRGGAPLTRDLLLAAYRRAHGRYRLRYQAVESVLSRLGSDDLTAPVARELCDALARLVPLLWTNAESAETRTSLIALRAKIIRKRQQLLTQIVVVHDAEFPIPNEHDQVAWTRKFVGVAPLLTCDLTAICAPPLSDEAVLEQPESLWLTETQAVVGQHLARCYRLHAANRAVLGYKLRPPLVIGPSGSGKSTLVKWLAAELRVPLFCVDSGSWMLGGSRAEQPTLVQISEFVEAAEAGIIFVDELDKFSGQDHSWWVAVNQELFQLIDRRLPWSSAKLSRLSRYLIIGAETWQEVFRRAGKTVGFRESQRPEPIIPLIEENLGIPEEVSFRFDQPIILTHPTADEFRDRIRALRSDLSMPPLSDAALDSLAADAVESRRGNRYIEGYLSRLLHAQERNRPVPQEQPSLLFEF